MGPTSAQGDFIFSSIGSGEPNRPASMLRVLISTSTFPLRPDDGLPRFVYDLAAALAERCEVVALAPDGPGAKLQERQGRVEVRRFSYFYPRKLQALAYGYGMSANLRTSLFAKLQPLPYVLAQAFATRTLVLQRQIQVVNSHWLLPQGLSSALARGASARFRHVLTLHGSDVYLLRRLPFGRQLARFIMSRTDAVFVVASSLREVLDDLLGRPSGAVVLPVGVDLELFRQPTEQLPMPLPFPGGYLLFVGRLHEIKGAQYLLRAMPEILRRHHGIGLNVVGYGPYEKALKREAERLGIANSVRFNGRQAHAEILRYFHGCRAVVVPSITEGDGRTEGMPTVVLEALASGARLVASAVGGVPDIIRHGDNGWLCREKNPADLAEKILVALEDPTSSGVLSRASETAERFAWPRVAERYLEAFERSESPT